MKRNRSEILKFSQNPCRIEKKINNKVVLSPRNQAFMEVSNSMC